jgi:hypothetical protein
MRDERQDGWQDSREGLESGAKTCYRVRFPVLLQRHLGFFAESDFGIFGRGPFEEVALLPA